MSAKVSKTRGPLDNFFLKTKPKVAEPEVQVEENVKKRKRSTIVEELQESDSDSHSSEFEFEKVIRKAKAKVKTKTSPKRSSLRLKMKITEPPKKTRGIMTYFGRHSNGSESESSAKAKEKEREKEKEKEAIKAINAATSAFLQSGLPDAIVKVQKSAVKKKAANDFLDTVGFFPKLSHNIKIEASSFTFDFAPRNWPFALLPDQSESSHSPSMSIFSGFIEHEIKPEFEPFCCNIPNSNPPFDPSGLTKKLDLTLTVSVDEEDSDVDGSALPWVEKYAVKRKKKLVVDKGSLQKFGGWLNQWKRDIDADGGLSRKIVNCGGSEIDSDIVSSEEEGEFKKKSVILCGPTGCGKTALVYVMAKSLGFKVVEVNFSSSRSGKEVMQRVEEATLSHRLSGSAEVDESHCLILFKDIDLLEPEEDKAFHTAIAQLISTSVRPIVMTICQPSTLDTKIEKRDPLWVYLKYPSPSAIVQKIILPIFKLETQCDKYDRNELTQISSILDSVVRHSNCDIRKSINQCQIVCAGKLFNLQRIHTDLSPLINFGCTTAMDGETIKNQLKSKTENAIEVPGPPSKAERQRNLEELDRLSKSMELLAEADTIWSSRSQIFDLDNEDVDTGIRVSLQSTCAEYLNFHIVSESRNIHRALMFRNDNDIMNDVKIGNLNDELSAYVDYVEDYDAKSYVRSILKTEVLNSAGLQAKRNRRLKGYFNRVNPDFVQRICETFDFQAKLEIAKAAVETNNTFT